MPDAAPCRVARGAAASPTWSALRELLAEAERPLVVVGGGGWSAAGRARTCVAFAEAAAIPVAASFRRQDYVDNDARRSTPATLGIGHEPALAGGHRARPTCSWRSAPGSATSPRAATRCSTSPRPRQRLVHVHPDPDELGARLPARAGDRLGLPEFAAAARALDPVDGAAARHGLVAEARAAYEENLRPAPRAARRAATWPRSWRTCASVWPDDAILTNGAGNYTVWAHRFYSFRRFGTQLAPRSPARWATACPAAIAAKVVHPERTVVCFAGDGDFLMSGQELATAVQEELPIVVLVVNNGMYGTIRMHQERHFPGPRRSAPTSSTPTSRRWPARSAPTASSCERTRGLPAPRSSARSRPGGRRCSSCGSIPRRSLRCRP